LIAKAPTPGSHNDAEVSVDVTNTGTREGDEIAQLYMHQDTSSVETPARALKGFSRIHLKPGETRTVTFAVPQHELEIWNAQGKWVVEPGQFTFWAGGSSQATLSTQIALKP
jgi:beta-glucosidase